MISIQTFNDDEQEHLNNPLFKLYPFTKSFAELMLLIGKDFNNPMVKDFRTAAILEFYDLEEKIVNLDSMPFSKDDMVSLKLIENCLFSQKLESKLSKYINHLNEKALDRLFTEAHEYWKQHKINLCINFSDNPIINLFLNLKIHVLRENIDEFVNMGLIINSNLITDKSKLVYKIINHLKIGSKKDEILNPLSNLIIKNYIFSVSKSTADKYIYEKIEILNDSLKNWGYSTVHNQCPYNYADDFRITTGLHSKQIMDYFMKLNVKNKSNDKLILSDEDITTLVNSNFQTSEKPVERKILNANIDKSDLKRFVYEFYNGQDKEQYNNRQKIYLDFLINNFTLFENETTDSLKSHFSQKRRNKYFL
jgi:hypothetical protein